MKEIINRILPLFIGSVIALTGLNLPDLFGNGANGWILIVIAVFTVIIKETRLFGIGIFFVKEIRLFGIGIFFVFALMFIGGIVMFMYLGISPGDSSKANVPLVVTIVFSTLFFAGLLMKKIFKNDPKYIIATLIYSGGLFVFAILEHLLFSKI